MALDYKAAIYGAIMTALTGNGTVASTFRSGNIHDDRTTGPQRRTLASRAAADKPSLDVEITGGDEARTATPNFGLSGPSVAVCDAIVPATVVLRLRLKFDPKSKLAEQTAAETAVRQALHQGYPRLGLAYVRDFTVRDARTPGDQNRAEAGVTQVDLTVTVNLRLRTSQLRD